jgi:hypothetical protein
MLNFKLKLLRMFRTESLAYARRRIRREIKETAMVGITTNPLSQAIDGYSKDRNVSYV